VRAYFYWPRCRLDPVLGSWRAPSRLVFWVGATEGEAGRLILTQHSADPLAIARLTDVEREDSYEYKGRLYFFVSQDLGTVELYFRVYPYSGMWGGDCPWVPIGKRRNDGGFGEPEGAELESLGQLRARAWVESVVLRGAGIE
jgi:hypothetical protein